MKAITLTQPWATLVAIGAKRIETRSWQTAYRGPLAIHAAAGLGPVHGKRGLLAICRRTRFCSALIRGGYGDRPDLPLGAIIAVCELVDCRRIDANVREYGAHTEAADIIWPLTDRERAFGDYTPGRYAWLLADVRPLAEPLPAKGALGLWEWDNNA